MYRRTAFAAFRAAWLVSALSFATLSFGQTNGISPPTNLHVALPNIPSLNWQPRSDWINVKSDVSPVAIGDGVADDTAALQAALNVTNVGKTIYIPAGAYRITQTLAMHNSLGSAVIGNGRDTRIVWAGTNGGVMFWSDGNPYTRYIGLSWDGRGAASVGFDHAAQQTFETEVQHVNESYRNFTGYGIRIGNNQVLASAEILYRNCLFANCGTGLGILAFNDYDNTIDHCEFENCGIGVFCNHGNFYARNSHFQNSSRADFSLYPEHGCSIRRCTSVGSYEFVNQIGTVTPITLQDCQVANWTGPYAVYVSDGPILIFDCVFSTVLPNPVPVYVNYSQSILLCNNNPSATNQLLGGHGPQHLYVITNGQYSGVLTNASQTFLQQTATVPGHTFDAKVNFGAKGDGVTDDTTAIQSALNAARQYGQGAIAYLPTGRYLVSQTLLVTGSNYTMGGSGFRCGLIWNGQAGAPFITVSNVQNVTLADFCVGNADFGQMNHGDDIWVTSTPGVPCRLTLDGVYGYGKYDLTPDKHGIHFDHLPAGSVAVVPAAEGHLRIDGCDEATLLFRASYEGTATVEGPPSGRDGFTGFLTRLATITNPALRVFDNQSVVMSDFYVEQSQQIAVFSGTTNEGPGTVTIQGPKAQMVTTNVPVVAIQGYAGRICYGQTQFYVQPLQTIFQSTNTPLLQVILSGCFWYDNSPVFNLDPAVTPTLMGNGGAPGGGPTDSGVTSPAMAAISTALDDLRKLGQLDNSLP